MCVLYTGLRPPEGFKGMHVPFIGIKPRTEALDTFFSLLPKATHLIFTSRTAAELVGATPPVIHLAVGKKTASTLKTSGQIFIAEEETAEGVASLIRPEEEAFYLWPRSSGARSVIVDYLKKNKLPFAAVDLYDVVSLLPDPLPDLQNITRVVFTSPSTVKAFVGAYGGLPDLALDAIGPVTKATLDSYGRTPHN